MIGWLLLALVWLALAVPTALLVGAALRAAEAEHERARAERPDASWCELSR